MHKGNAFSGIEKVYRVLVHVPMGMLFSQGYKSSLNSPNFKALFTTMSRTIVFPG
jgi:hypothetical protein